MAALAVHTPRAAAMLSAAGVYTSGGAATPRGTSGPADHHDGDAVSAGDVGSGSGSGGGGVGGGRDEDGDASAPPSGASAAAHSEEDVQEAATPVSAPPHHASSHPRAAQH